MGKVYDVHNHLSHVDNDKDTHKYKYKHKDNDKDTDKYKYKHIDNDRSRVLTTFSLSSYVDFQEDPFHYLPIIISNSITYMSSQDQPIIVTQPITKIYAIFGKGVLRNVV